MCKRNSFIKNVDIKSIELGSVMQVGDSVQLSPMSNVIAVNREVEVFYGNEGNFQLIPLFSEPIPIPVAPYTLPTINKYNELPDIRIGTIAIKGISASAILHVGNIENAVLESRIWHQRQLTKSNDQNITRKE
ncbi:spore germination protein GerPE [Bacillus sp. FSL K6-3431]|uniref:spore germination protein GerPE n=1 Tax=Bacillus sp. FSL K6-3431 TaxID=2921500 RepID=UPI0030FABC6E